MNKKSAFTLAEVLITLAILGVVAAISIPNLINHYKRAFVEKRILDFYTSITSAFEQSQAINGPIETWVNDPTISAFPRYPSYNIPIKYIVPYLNIQKVYPRAYSGIQSPYGTTQFIKAPNSDENILYTYSFIFSLKNGIYFSTDFNIQKDENGNEMGIIAQNFNNSYPGYYYGKIGTINFDINGPKAPNQCGKDVFRFNIYKDRDGGYAYIGPYEYSRYMYQDGLLDELNKRSCRNGPGNAFWKCTNIIMRNNFKIPKDYPWL